MLLLFSTWHTKKKSMTVNISCIFKTFEELELDSWCHSSVSHSISFSSLYVVWDSSSYANELSIKKNPKPLKLCICMRIVRYTYTHIYILHSKKNFTLLMRVSQYQIPRPTTHTNNMHNTNVHWSGIGEDTFIHL